MLKCDAPATTEIDSKLKDFLTVLNKCKFVLGYADLTEDASSNALLETARRPHSTEDSASSNLRAISFPICSSIRPAVPPRCGTRSVHKAAAALIEGQVESRNLSAPTEFGCQSRGAPGSV